MTTFRCPATGLTLERPPATDIRDEYLRLVTLSIRDRITTIADDTHRGHYRAAAAGARRLATYLDPIPDRLHDLLLDIEDEAGDIWTTHDHEDTPA